MRHKEEIPVLVAEIKDELSKLEILVQKLSSQKNRTKEAEGKPMKNSLISPFGLWLNLYGRMIAEEGKPKRGADYE